LHCRGAVQLVPFVADPVLVDEEHGVIDLATGEAVRLTIAAVPTREDAPSRRIRLARTAATHHA
jgi:hypothetical protein